MSKSSLIHLTMAGMRTIVCPLLILIVLLSVAPTPKVQAASLEVPTQEVGALEGTIPVLIFDKHACGWPYSLHLYESGHFGLIFLGDDPDITRPVFGRLDAKDYQRIIAIVEAADFMKRDLPWRRPQPSFWLDGPCFGKLTYYKDGRFKVYYGDQAGDPLLQDLGRAINEIITPSRILNSLRSTRPQ